MKRTIPGLLAAALTAALFLSGCSTVVSVVSGLFATPTSTATATSTATLTATVTVTPTATPLPPVTFHPCPQREPCGSSYNIYDFVGVKVESGVEYPVTIPYDVPVSFRAGWIAKDLFTITQNLEHMTPFFEIDGQPYFRAALQEIEPYRDENGNMYSVSWVGVVISGWEIGEQHTFRMGYTINDKITDGWNVYQPGAVIEYTYRVNPEFIPTVTSTPRATATMRATVTPTYRPRPTAVPVTPTPACDADSPIYINNDTGGTLTLYLSGPAKFTFTVGTGSQTINVCPGSYSYTAYGCGGATRSGTMNSSETHDFWCE